MIKNILTGFLISFIMFYFVSLSAAEKTPIVLSTWVADAQEKRAMANMIKRFEKKYPNIKVDYRIASGQYNDYLKTKLSAGIGPDVFWVDSSQAKEYISMGVLEEIKDYDITDFYKVFTDVFTQDGKLYGIPKDCATLSLFYNKDIFIKAGVEFPKDSMSWEDFIALSKKVTKNGIYGVGITLDLARTEYQFKAEGVLVEKDEKSKMYDPVIEKVITEYIKNFQEGNFVTPEKLGKSWDGELFGAQKVAMVVEGPWLIPFLNDSFKNLNYATAVIPKNIFGRLAAPAYTVAYVLNKKSKHKEAARKFIDYVTSKRGMTDWIAEAKVLPTRKSVEKDLNIAQDDILKSFVKATKYLFAWSGSKYKSYIFSEYTNMLPVIMDGELSVAEGLKQIDEDANNAIEAVKY